MTIDEAIAQERKRAKIHRYNSCHIDALLFTDDTEEMEEAENRCIKCAEEHEQLAEWLEELNEYRILDKTKFSDGYNKAIDDFSKEIDKYIEHYDGTIYEEAYYPNVKSDFEELKEIVEQLKEGRENEN